MAIGNLDEDAYADIAVACGGDLTIVHGRGQAYPWDLADEFGIKRPGAVVADRKMPFQIAALAVGDFDGRRGEDLAILGGDGSVYNLAPTRAEKPANNKLTVEAKARAATSAFLPSDASLRNLGAIADPRISQEEGEKLGLTYADADDLKSGRFEEILKKRTDEQVEKVKAADKDELKKAGAENMAKTLAEREQSKAAFLRSISAKPSTLANWDLETLISDARLTSAAYSPISKKFLKARVSDSGRDDLILLDANSKQIQIVSQPSAVSGQQSAENGDDPKSKIQNPKTEIVSLDIENSPVAVLPMRLNGDALSDLVVLRQGASVPSVLMSAPSLVITVNSATDGFGDCVNGNDCTLRSAIQLADSTGGTPEIDFNIAGGGVQTISLVSQLPIITRQMTIDGTTQPGYNGLPLIELTGANLPTGISADGLKIRTTGATVRGLAVNMMPSRDNSNGSVTGGNGITIESTNISPNNGFNIVEANFLGTDATGSFAVGNSGNQSPYFQGGIYSFTNFSDRVFIGDANPFARNIVSGNTNENGISVFDLGGQTKVVNNLVDLNRSLAPLGNGGNGIILQGFGTQIGGATEQEANQIAYNGSGGNNFAGVLVSGGAYSGGAFGNTIRGNTSAGILLDNSLNNLIKHNFVGTDGAGANDLGNGADGVLVTDNSRLNTVGGAETDAGNQIAFNGGAGVRLDETAGHCNLVDPNSIYGNTGLGVDIGAPGTTPNDLHDPDEGANRGQNYPDLNYSINGSNQLIVNYKVDSAPGNSNYGANGIYVEFFKADASGQGETFLGFGYYAAADYNNGAPLSKQINLGDAAALGFAPGDKVTATATDADNNTSEFTPVIISAPTAANVSTGGRVLTASGRGIRGARLSLTDSRGNTRTALSNPFGFYRFTEVPAGETYVLRATAKRFEFYNRTQVLDVTEEMTEINFTAAQ